MRSTFHQVQLRRLDFSSYTYSVNDDNILKCNTTYSLVLDDSKMLHSEDSSVAFVEIHWSGSTSTKIS
jgi:hypothetical protein